MFGEGLGFFYEDRPVFGDGHFTIEEGSAFAGLDADGDAELALRAAAVDAVRGGDVGVVATDGGADVTIAGDEVVGGIEADPAQFREKRFNPGVGGGALGPILVGVAVVEVAADVAAGNLELRAYERDHDVGEVLADACLGGEGDLDGGVGLGGLRLVVKVLAELGIELVECAERIIRTSNAEVSAKVFELGGELGKLAREKHLPEVTLVDEAVELFPGAGAQGLRHFGMFRHLDEGFGDDDKLTMLAGDVKVVDVVGEVVAVAEDATAWAHRKVKGKAALLSIGARVHAGLHHALADRVAIEELGEMADRVVHG